MKQLISNYTINTTNKTITLPDFTTLVKERLLLITDTTNQTTPYQFNTSTGVSVSGNVITFTTFTPTANTDTLQIYYDTKQGDPHYDDWQLLADTAGNQVVTTGTVTAADTATTSTAGQNGQNLLTGTPTSGSAYSFGIPNVNGTPESLSSIVIQISGTFVATYQFERSPDNGTTWTTFSPFTAGLPLTSSTGTLPGQFHGNIAGVTNVRVRCTSYTSGTINVRFSMGIGTGTITVGNPLKLIDRAANIQATIKDSSVSPAATDTSLVITTSPNSPDVTTLSTISANQTSGNQQAQGNVGSGATDTGNPVKVGGRYNGTLPTLTSGQRGDIQLDASGRLIVSGQSATGTALPPNAFYVGASDGTNLVPLRTNIAGDASGATLHLGVQTSIYNGTTYDRLRSATAAVSAGTGTLGIANVPTTTGLALTSFQNTAILATAVAVKSGAGRLHRITIYNPNTALAWLQIFDATSATAGTTTPKMSIPILQSGIFEDYYAISDTFATGIMVAATTTATGSAAPTTGLFVSLGYV